MLSGGSVTVDFRDDERRDDARFLGTRALLRLAMINSFHRLSDKK
ncbi:hypothetical protein L248_1267 [Schleiferilactobacillus shenzhenensis LY-73]|uniref:Uncharacterized protein n=1 Tax=Schleiferilactobacillus shenzhenensis LY-73 TaxID=1231336 RepID=U4TRU4_9LACO|nr:hypothetical protein L248_1267 [Schleiferilactobacillus shenzhenensis LY-73]